MRLTEAMATYAKRTLRSAALWKQAAEWTPLGVHSNYRYIDPHPLFVRRGSGSRLWDVDENEYLDFNMGFGALQSGHAHPKVVEAVQAQVAKGTHYGYEWELSPTVAEKICRRYGQAQVRFSTTGLEATHHAVRIARAVTGRSLLLKFEGGYHGSHDTLLVGVKPRPEVAGPARQPNSVPASLGIPPEVTGKTLVAPFNDLEATRAIVRAHRNDLAAILTEPIPMNMGFILPEPGFMPGLRELCDEVGALLLFDEVKTGTKYYRGAAPRVGVKPDLIVLGKSISSGVPVSAIVTRAGLLDQVGPKKIAHAGTYNSNPLAMAACLATLDHVLTEDGIARSTRLSDRLAAGYREVLTDAHLPAYVAADGVSGMAYFTDHVVRDWRTFCTVDSERWMLYFYSALNRGLIPSGTGPDEQWTISVAHTEADVDRHLSVLREVAPTLRGETHAGTIDEAV